MKKENMNPFSHGTFRFEEARRVNDNHLADVALWGIWGHVLKNIGFLGNKGK